mmetsp:Transcript_1358/g.3425  ORF Transcript_1358/g.3425 Transcript_1358/m.3425 type:complete len:266 (-) Transcript_1358:64-861(-)
MPRASLQQLISPCARALGAPAPPRSLPVARSSALVAARSKGGGSSGAAMRGVKKENLPSKVCIVCERPFTWRKKWERCWDEVTTCSKRCNAQRRAGGKPDAADGGAVDGSDSEAEEERHERRRAAPPSGLIGGRTQQGGESSADEVSDAGEAHARAERKAAKKAMKAERRAQREGRADKSAGQKPCDGCGKGVDLLVRCTVDASGAWRMMCGRCWQDASGGVADGDAAHPHYRYGGLWKNRRAARGTSTTPPLALQGKPAESRDP